MVAKRDLKFVSQSIQMLEILAGRIQRHCASVTHT
jgi:hypothetical protein